MGHAFCGYPLSALPSTSAVSLSLGPSWDRGHQTAASSAGVILARDEALGLLVDSGSSQAAEGRIVVLCPRWSNKVGSKIRK